MPEGIEIPTGSDLDAILAFAGKFAGAIVGLLALWIVCKWAIGPWLAARARRRKEERDG